MSNILLQCGCFANSVTTVEQGKTLDTPKPSCVIHGCSEPWNDEPDLTNRIAKCSCGKKEPSTKQGLAFLSFKGEGSYSARVMCKHCPYAYQAHVYSNDRINKEPVKCVGFEPHGAYEFDEYYCGHSGFD